MDITEKKKLESLKADVERIIRHDLKTPLNGIIGFPQVMMADENLTKEQIEYLKLIEYSGKKMRDMINLSLDMYKMETGTFQPHLVPVDLIPMFSECLTDLESVAAQKNVDLELERGQGVNPDGSVIVSGERLLCYSMFSNLILNAIEASPAGGRVLIKLERTNRLEITIHNQGTVPKELRDEFFAKYKTQGKPDGTGLGTYSAKLYAEALGGGIGMRSSEEEGTSITIALQTPDK